MNIDSSSLNSLLTSSGEGLEKLQQTLQADGMVSEEFADTLMAKIKQLNGTGEPSTLSENINSQSLSDTEEQQELAGLLNESDITTGFSNLLGNSLPIDNKEKESSLETLSNAINAVVEKIELLKTSEPEQVEQLGKAVEALQEIKLSIEDKLKQVNAEDQKEGQGSDNPLIKEDLSSSAHLIERLDTVIDKVQQVMGFVSKENVLADAEIKIETEDIDGVDKNIKVNVDADNKINIDSEDELEFLSIELETIRKEVAQKIVKKPNEKKQEIDGSNQAVELRDEEDNELQIVNQIAAIVATMSEPLKAEQMVAESKVVTGQVFQDMKRESVSIKQMPAEKTLETVVDDEPSNLLQQENKFGRSRQENPVVVTKQNGKIDASFFKEAEINNEKSVPKFATDLAMLNRAVITENKVEIPPMTKHFAHPEWNKEMGERVIWMHKQEIPSAELRLNPKHLGPVTIKVDVTQDQATVAFTAQHAVVKEAIEAALPKLREMLSAQQLNLVDVNVSQNDSGQRQAKDSNQMGAGAGDGKNKETNEMFNNEQAEKTMEIADEIEAGRAIASNGVLSIFA